MTLKVNEKLVQSLNLTVDLNKIAAFLRNYPDFNIFQANKYLRGLEDFIGSKVQDPDIMFFPEDELSISLFTAFDDDLSYKHCIIFMCSILGVTYDEYNTSVNHVIDKLTIRVDDNDSRLERKYKDIKGVFDLAFHLSSEFLPKVKDVINLGRFIKKDLLPLEIYPNILSYIIGKYDYNLSQSLISSASNSSIRFTNEPRTLQYQAEYLTQFTKRNIINNRHMNSESQELYDRQFGLVPFKSK